MNEAAEIFGLWVATSCTVAFLPMMFGTFLFCGKPREIAAKPTAKILPFAPVHRKKLISAVPE